MAKRKTPKMKNLRPEKITTEELGKIQSTAQAIDRAYHQLGNLESEKHSLLHMVATFQKTLADCRTEFTNKYGTDEVSMVDGTINYNADAVKANS